MSELTDVYLWSSQNHLLRVVIFYSPIFSSISLLNIIIFISIVLINQRIILLKTISALLFDSKGMHIHTGKVMHI